MLGARNTRNCHSESSKIIKENSSISHSKSLDPRKRSVAVVPVEVAPYRAQQLIERLRSGGVRFQARVHLYENFIQQVREVSG